VAATVAEAGLMTYQHLPGAQLVAIETAGGWLGYPLPVGGSDELTLNAQQPMTRPATRGDLGWRAEPIRG
jgi:hypothetical protein